MDDIKIDSLIWNDWNINHIIKHNVIREEVDEVCQSDPIFLQGHSGRILAVGKTQKGRFITIALDPEGNNSYYPVTARPSSRAEREYYDDVRKEKN